MESGAGQLLANGSGGGAVGSGASGGGAAVVPGGGGMSALTRYLANAPPLPDKETMQKLFPLLPNRLVYECTGGPIESQPLRAAAGEW